MSLKRLLPCLLFMAALFSATMTWALDREEYVDSVLIILRSHAQLLEELAQGNRFKYSDNLVRHARAIRDTFGLLGPMEWHASEAAEIHSEEVKSGEPLSEEKFEELALASSRSLVGLVRAAHDSMEEYDRQGLASAIKEMKESCHNCHSLLPETTAPRVWPTELHD